MISYKDMTFCCSPECVNKCGRKLTDEIKAAAARWWGSDDAPISMAHFCGERGNVLPPIKYDENGEPYPDGGAS